MKTQTPSDRRALEIDRRARARGDDRDAFTAALAELEALPEPGAIVAVIRGRLHADLGDPDAAARAYEQAIQLAPKMSDAHYELGLVHAAAGREEDALRAWEAAVEADPRHFDALYNAGQAHYNRGEPAEALEMWRRASEVDPESFDALKKMVQAEIALGRDPGPTQARLLEVWRTSKRPEVRRLGAYVFDQLEVEGLRVMGLAPLADPLPPDADAMRFQVEGAPGQTVLLVRVESSAYGRERGTPYVLSVTSRAGYRVVATLSALPPYPELRDKVREIVSAALVKGP